MHAAGGPPTVDKDEPRLLGDMGCDQEDCEDIQISPNGEFAMWSAKKQIWIAPISPKSDGRPEGKTDVKADAKSDTKAKASTFARGSNSQPSGRPDGVIDRSLVGTSDSIEWCDLAETKQQDPRVEVYRKPCDTLSPLVNRPAEMDEAAVAELRSIIEELRLS